MGGDDAGSPGGPSWDTRAEALEALRDIASIDLEWVDVGDRDDSGAGRSTRPELHDVATEESGRDTTVTVELGHRGRRATVSRTAGLEDHGVLRAVAGATLDAIIELLPPRVAELHLDGLEILDVQSPSRPAVVHCAVALRTARGHELLSGTAVLDGTIAETTARATLDALNRRFDRLTGS
jgi:hypothetical protein